MGEKLMMWGCIVLVVLLLLGIAVLVIGAMQWAKEEQRQFEERRNRLNERQKSPSTPGEK